MSGKPAPLSLANPQVTEGRTLILGYPKVVMSVIAP